MTPTTICFVKCRPAIASPLRASISAMRGFSPQPMSKIAPSTKTLNWPHDNSSCESQPMCQNWEFVPRSSFVRQPNRSGPLVVVHEVKKYPSTQSSAVRSSAKPGSGHRLFESQKARKWSNKLGWNALTIICHGDRHAFGLLAGPSTPNSTRASELSLRPSKH